MKTIAQVKKERKEYQPLITAVIKRIGKSSVMDVVNYGASSGFSGFIYYSDTVKFAYSHRKPIISLLDELSDDMGIDTVSMICQFGYFNGRANSEDKKEIYRYLSGSKCKEDTIPNLMAWFALEEVCRWFED